MSESSGWAHRAAQLRYQGMREHPQGEKRDEIGMIASGFLEGTEQVIQKNKLVRGKHEWHQSAVMSRQ